MHNVTVFLFALGANVVFEFFNPGIAFFPAPKLEVRNARIVDDLLSRIKHVPK